MQFDTTFRVVDLIMIFAVLSGPVVAVQLTERLRQSKEKRERKDGIFRILMATRNANLAPNHVEALNLVDVLFHGPSHQEKKVVESWRLYLSHLNDGYYPREAWGIRRSDLLVELLFEMGTSLGYSFERSHIKSGTYYPGGYSDAEIDQLETRKLWLEVLKGSRGIHIFDHLYSTQTTQATYDVDPNS